MFDLIEPVQAEIVRAALHIRRRERDVERLPKRRDVLEEDLLLEGLGAGRDEHSLSAQDGGDEVRQRLARTRSGFREQRAAVLEATGNRLGHLHLAGPRLEVGEGERQRAPALERLGGQRRESG